MIDSFLKRILMILLFLAGTVQGTVAASLPQLTLENALTKAIKGDRWLRGNRLAQEAKLHQANAASALPDPKVAFKVMNLPTDSWELDQEMMTQISLGLSQTFPRGQSLELQSKKLRIEASAFSILREEREAKLTRLVSKLWLDAYLAQQTIRLIESDRALFEQLVEIAKANYSNTIGKTRQQDVIRAQLEIAHLEDRITLEQNHLAFAKTQLHEWIYQPKNLEVNAQSIFDKPQYSLPTSPPKIDSHVMDPNAKIIRKLKNHPSVRALDVKHQVALNDIRLAEQLYKPQWQVNASYGFRDNATLNLERSDLFSLELSFDLPLFTSTKQDPTLKAAAKQAGVVKSDRYLLIKQMASALGSFKKQITYLKKRQKLYQNRLLKQAHDQAEAAITAYTNDDGDFAEVARARIAEMNARIQALKIDVEILKSTVQSNYLLAQSKVELNYE